MFCQGGCFVKVVVLSRWVFCQGGCLQHFKGRCFVKVDVDVCNILNDGVLSRWVFATFYRKVFRQGGICKKFLQNTALY